MKHSFGVFKDYVDWDLVSIYQTLSETFIEYFKHWLNIDFVIENQNLSHEFIKKLSAK